MCRPIQICSDNFTSCSTGTHRDWTGSQTDPRCGLDVVMSTEVPTFCELNPDLSCCSQPCYRLNYACLCFGLHSGGNISLPGGIYLVRVFTNIRSLIISFLTLWLLHRYKRTDIHRGCFYLDMKHYFNWLYLDEWLDDEACTDVDCHLLREREGHRAATSPHAFSAWDVNSASAGRKQGITKSSFTIAARPRASSSLGSSVVNTKASPFKRADSTVSLFQYFPYFVYCA